VGQMHLGLKTGHLCPIFKFATSSGSKKKEPRCACKKNPSKSLVRDPPLYVPPNRVPMERDAPSPEPMVYSFIYICLSSQKRPLPQNAEKT